VTQRRPPDVRFETWVERQIREAAERGEFDNLPGSGKPIPDTGEDELWWVKDYLRREELSTEALLPTSLRLRKEIERLPATVGALPTEHEVRDVVRKLNRRIMDWLRTPTDPVVLLVPLDVDDVVQRWREAREAITDKPAGGVDSSPQPPPQRAGWWRRHLKRGQRQAP
jgi:hypothetical protein